MSSTDYSRVVPQAQLIELTGYIRPARQARILREKWGIEPFISSHGHCWVMRDVLVEAQHRLSGLEVQAATRQGPRPNMKVVR